MRRSLCLALVCCLWLAIPSFAQKTSGEIRGTVTDASGAVVAGAEVSVTNSGTGTTRTATTNESGGYAALDLQDKPRRNIATPAKLDARAGTGNILDFHAGRIAGVVDDLGCHPRRGAGAETACCRVVDCSHVPLPVARTFAILPRECNKSRQRFVVPSVLKFGL